MLNPPSPVAAAPRWFAWAGIVILGIYAAVLAPRISVEAGGSDSSGYLNSARALASGHLRAPLRASPPLMEDGAMPVEAFQPLGFRAYPDDLLHLAPTYPSGLPLHLALASAIAGWHVGPLIVSVGAVIALAWLCYAVGRELGLDHWFAAAAAVIVAVFPPLLFAVVQVLSDNLSAAWSLAAMWAALRAARQPRYALLAGAAFGVAVLVRPTNIVLLPALVVFLGPDSRRIGLTLLGGLPAAAWLAYYNYSLYGGVFRSGYPPLSDSFAWARGGPTLLHFGQWLACFLPAVLLILPFFAVTGRAARREDLSRNLLGLAFWFGANVELYAFYEVSHEAWSCLRFILPAVPALVLAGLLGLAAWLPPVGSSRVDLQACKLEYSIVSPK